MSGQPVINEVEKNRSLGLYGRMAAPPVWRTYPRPGKHSQHWSCRATTFTKNQTTCPKILASQHWWDPSIHCWEADRDLQKICPLDAFSPLRFGSFSLTVVILEISFLVGQEIQGNGTTAKLCCDIWVKLERLYPGTNLHLMHCADNKLLLLK